MINGLLFTGRSPDLVKVAPMNSLHQVSLN